MSDAKEKILNAAIEEFGLYGFENASTNRIMERGEVSKGLIFHYFGNKRKLYMACAQHVIDLFVQRFDMAFDPEEKDFFKRYESVVAFKTKFMADNPSMGKFMMDMGKNYLEKTIPELTDYTNTIYRERWKLLSEGVDTSPYRKNIPSEKAIEHIMIVMEAYANRYHFEMMSYDEIFEILPNYFREMEMVKELIFHGIWEE